MSDSIYTEVPKKRVGRPISIGLTGQKFGKLTVSHKNLENPGKYNCLCDCGNTILIQEGGLTGKYGKRSCGCTPTPTKEARKAEMIGSVFGYWTVISRSDKPNNWKSYLWECHCVCGKIAFLDYGALTKGHNHSCGCCIERRGESNHNYIHGKDSAKSKSYRRSQMTAYCEICGRSEGVRLCWDHDHNSTPPYNERYRGTLCCNCNNAIGLFQDSPEILASAMSYLKRELPRTPIQL